MGDGNYIKINRNILQWEWYSDMNTCRLFIHMLLIANWKEGKYKGITVPRGSFISSIGHLSSGTNLTQDEVRTAIKHLISTKEITKQSTNKFTVFTIKNYDLYQEQPKQNPSKAQAIPKLFPTIEEGKKEKKKEDKKTNIVQESKELFEELWNVYPLKRGKGQISDTVKKQILDIGREEMIRAIARYKADLQKETWRKPQNGSTFFNSGYLDYLDSNYSARAEDSQRGKAPVRRPSENRFHNFDQRDTDYDAMIQAELLES